MRDGKRLNRAEERADPMPTLLSLLSPRARKRLKERVHSRSEASFPRHRPIQSGPVKINTAGKPSLCRLSLVKINRLGLFAFLVFFFSRERERDRAGSSVFWLCVCWRARLCVALRVLCQYHRLAIFIEFSNLLSRQLYLDRQTP